MLNKNFFNKAYSIIICLLIFLIPSNLFFKIDLSQAYVNGLLVDYLIPKIYLSDIFIFSLITLWLIEVKASGYKKNIKTIPQLPTSILLSILIIRQVFTPHFIAGVWYLFKIGEFFFLGWFLTNHNHLLKKTSTHLAITITILFQASLGIWQFITQKSLGGYQLLGEPTLAHSIGLAKDTWWQTGRVLPYATTAHPNILGGILAIFSLIIIKKLPNLKNNWSKLTAIISLILSIFLIILTQSISAILTFILGLILLTRKQISNKLLATAGIFFFLAIPIFINVAAKKFPHQDSFNRRAYLQTAALRMSMSNPITGVGLNQFTAKVEEYSLSKEIVRFVQPVHHLGLLWLAETGILGTLWIGLLVRKFKFKKLILPLTILLPIITLDHYLLTQQTGLLLLIFTLQDLGKSQVKN